MMEIAAMEEIAQTLAIQVTVEIVVMAMVETVAEEIAADEIRYNKSNVSPLKLDLFNTST